MSLCNILFSRMETRMLMHDIITRDINETVGQYCVMYDFGYYDSDE